MIDVNGAFSTKTRLGELLAHSLRVRDRILRRLDEAARLDEWRHRRTYSASTLSAATATMFGRYGGTYYTGDEDRQVIEWDGRCARRVRSFVDPGSSASVSSLAVSYDAKLLVAGRGDGRASLWALPDGSVLAPPPAQKGILEVASTPLGAGSSPAASTIRLRSST